MSAVAQPRAALGGPAPREDETVLSPIRRRGAPMPMPAPYAPKPPALALAYAAASTVIAMTQGLGLNLISANLAQLQGPLGTTTNETVWLAAAYLAPNVSLTLFLTKMRAQFGLRAFARVAIVLFVLVTLGHLLVDDLPSAIAMRFFAGAAASPMSSLGFLYMMEPFPPEKKLSVGLSLALTNIAIASPLARLISPALLDLGDWNALFLLESGLALVCFTLINLLPLSSPPKTPVIEVMDLVSYVFIALGLGSLAVVLTVGAFYWWTEEPNLGWLAAGGVASLTVAATIELNRTNPLIDLRWISSPQILHFAGTLLLFRLVLSEQASGAPGLFQTLGLQNAQMTGLYIAILGGSFVAGAFCALVTTAERAPLIHALALSLLIAGALLDSHSTVLTRPSDMLLSQAMIGAAGVMFLPPAMAVGFASAMKRGPNYILSFLIVFLVTQSIGGAAGSALFRTFVTWREKFHSSQIAENVVMAHPLVASRVGGLGNAYASVLPDPSLRQAEGLSLLASQATQQATVLAYNDAFLMVALLASLGLLALVSHVAFKSWRSWRTPSDAPSH